MTRQFLTDALLHNARPDEKPYGIEEARNDDDDDAQAMRPPPAPTTPADGQRCNGCGAKLQWCEVGRCLRCTAGEPAAAHAVRLRYRADHVHNRPLVAAFDALYELEVAQAGGRPDKLNAAEAFSRAAAVFKAAPRQLRDEEDVANLPFVGEKVVALAGEFLLTGHMQRLEQLRRHARTVAVAALMRVPWVGAATATAWAAAGARSAADVRTMDAQGTLQPPLQAGRSLQRVAIEHAEEVRWPAWQQSPSA